jgi:hypothetical protein
MFQIWNESMESIPQIIRSQPFDRKGIHLDLLNPSFQYESLSHENEPRIYPFDFGSSPFFL